MKRFFLLMAAVCLAASTTLWAQMPTKLGITSPEMSRQADPNQRQMIKNAEAAYMQSYNNKNAPHLKTPDIDRLSRQTLLDMRAQEFYNSSVANTPDKALQLATQAYNMASYRMKQALVRKSKAERDFVALRQKQMLECAKLEQKQSKASSDGLTAKERAKQEAERTKLHKKHVNQRLKIQQRYMNAVNTVNDCEIIIERAKVEMEKYI